MNNDSFTIKSGSYETTIIDTHFDLSAWYPTLSTLNTPTDLIPTTSNDTITISWNCVQNAETYTVYYKKSSEQDYSSLIVDTNSATIINLEKNIVYNIYVKANNITETVKVEITAHSKEYSNKPVYIDYTYIKYTESNNSSVINQLVIGE